MSVCDGYFLFRYGLFDESEYSLLRKCVLFYASISSKTLDRGFNASAIDKLTNYKIRTELLPVIRRKEHFDLGSVKAKVKKFIDELMILAPQEQELIFCFENKRYMPELLFDDKAIVGRIKEHPMILWKMRN